MHVEKQSRKRMRDERKQAHEPRKQNAKHNADEEVTLWCLLKRETEHLWLRQLMHGIGRDPFRRA